MDPREAAATIIDTPNLNPFSFIVLQPSRRETRGLFCKNIVKFYKKKIAYYKILQYLCSALKNKRLWKI